MTVNVSVSGIAHLEDALPRALDPDKLYLLPTRFAVSTDESKEPGLCYADEVRYLPKLARANGLPLEFSQPEGERKFLQEFSADAEVWSIGLALLSIVNEWLILAVTLLIAHRADREGWTDDKARTLPLKVQVVETLASRSVEIEGPAAGVLEALRLLEPGKPEDHPEDD